MATTKDKKYLSLTRLTEYDVAIKGYVDAGDAAGPCHRIRHKKGGFGGNRRSKVNSLAQITQKGKTPQPKQNI